MSISVEAFNSDIVTRRESIYRVTVNGHDSYIETNNSFMLADYFNSDSMVLEFLRDCVRFPNDELELAVHDRMVIKRTFKTESPKLSPAQAMEEYQLYGK